MTQKEKDILIHKWLSKQLNSEEELLFNDIVKTDPSFSDYINEVTAIWEASLSYEPVPPVDSEISWQKIQKATLQESQVTRAFWVRPLQVAASILALVAIGFLLKTTFLSHKDFITTVAQETNQLIRLSDGSQVWLDKDATISCPSTFGSKKREVELKGQAFFDVSKDYRAFIIHTPLSQIKVLGTAFQVEAATNETTVIVKSGKVELKSRKSGRKILLESYDRGIQDIKTIRKEKLPSLNDLFWHTDELTFTSTPLESVISQLSDHFDISVQIEREEMHSCLFTSALTQNNLDEIIAILVKTYAFDVLKKEGQIILRSGICK